MRKKSNIHLNVLPRVLALCPSDAGLRAVGLLLRCPHPPTPTPPDPSADDGVCSAESVRHLLLK